MLTLNEELELLSGISMYKKLDFMRESNAIEGEMESPQIGRVNPGDIKALHYLFSAKCSPNKIEPKTIKQLHKILGAYLKKDWVGKWRDRQVYIGKHTPPSPEEVPKLMREYCKNFGDMNAWEAHNRYEEIHPFTDLNGRTGRLLWLLKAVDEGYRFTIPFLRMYYYQTLEQYEKQRATKSV